MLHYRLASISPMFKCVLVSTWRATMHFAHLLSSVGLKMEDYVTVDQRFFRPVEVEVLVGDPAKAKKKLGWVAETTLEQLVREGALLQFRHMAVRSRACRRLRCRLPRLGKRRTPISSPGFFTQASAGRTGYLRPVIHLWHPEAERSQLARNEDKLADVLAGNRVRALRGLSSLQGPSKTAARAT